RLAGLRRPRTGARVRRRGGLPQALDSGRLQPRVRSRGRSARRRRRRRPRAALTPGASTSHTMTGIERAAYAPEAVSCGIVHVGLGAFHRAHQAVYVDAWLGRNRGGPWGIRAANIRSNGAIVAQLRAAGFRYHVAAYASRERVAVRAIRSICDATFAGAGDDAGRERLLAWLSAPETRIVTLTISEKGYGLRPADGALLESDPGLAHDIANPLAPRTAPGFLVEALRRRREAGAAPFTVLSCDNMPANGVRTRAAVAQLARHSSAELADWIEREVSFPSSMVDRIVPAVT